MIPNHLIIFPVIMILFSSRTTKRPVPLEHCLFYSGELYKICESETFLPQGLKAAKDASKRRHLTAAGGSGSKPGSASHDNARIQKGENTSRVKQHGTNFSRTGKGYQNNGNGQSNWRAEASMWLMHAYQQTLQKVLIACMLI